MKGLEKVTHDIWQIVKKEAKEQIISRKFAILAFLMLLVATLATYGASKMSYPSNALNALVICFAAERVLAAILCFTFSFDSFSGEKSSRTMQWLLSCPISRLSVVFGKLLSSSVVVGMLFISPALMSYVFMLGVTGTTPTLRELGWVFASLAAMLLLVSSLCSLGLLVSILTDTPRSSMIIVALLLVTFFVANASGFSIGSHAIGQEIPLGVSVSQTPVPFEKFPWYAKVIYWVDLPNHAKAESLLSGDWKASLEGLAVYQHLAILFLVGVASLGLGASVFVRQDIR